MPLLCSHESACSQHLSAQTCAHGSTLQDGCMSHDACLAHHPHLPPSGCLSTYMLFAQAAPQADQCKCYPKALLGWTAELSKVHRPSGKEKHEWKRS